MIGAALDKRVFDETVSTSISGVVAMDLSRPLIAIRDRFAAVVFTSVAGLPRMTFICAVAILREGWTRLSNIFATGRLG